MSGVGITGKLSTLGVGGYPLLDQADLEGGWRSVPDVPTRDAIPALNRALGMQVYVIDEDTTYQLGEGVTNADWRVVGASNGPNPNSVLSGDSLVYIPGGDPAFNLPITVVELDGWVFVANFGEQTFAEINPISGRVTRVIRWVNPNNVPIGSMVAYSPYLITTDQLLTATTTGIQAGDFLFGTTGFAGSPGPSSAVSPANTFLSGATGATDGSTTFTDLGATFITSTVLLGDRLVILSGPATGTYKILAIPSETTLTLETAAPLDVGPVTYTITRALVLLTFPFGDPNFGPLWAAIDIPTMSTPVNGYVFGAGVQPNSLTATYDLVNDHFWVSSLAGATLWGFNPTNADIAPSITTTDALLTAPGGIVAASGWLWVVDTTGAAAPGVLRVNLVTGVVHDKLTDGVALTAPTNIAYDSPNDRIWVIDTATNALVKINPSTNAIDGSPITLIMGVPGDFFGVNYAAGFIWASQTSLNVVIRVNPVTGDQLVISLTGAGYLYNREHRTRGTDFLLEVTNDDGTIFTDANNDSIPLPAFPRFDGQQHTIIDVSGDVIAGYELGVTSIQGIIGQTLLSGNYSALTFRWSTSLGMWLSI